MNPEEHFNKYLSYFKELSDNELIEIFNAEVNNKGWTSQRGAYLSAILVEFKNRYFDYSMIGSENRLSLNNKIKLVSGKIIIAED